MLFGAEILTLAGIMSLAADPVRCTVPRAPTVTILPTTDPVRYDNSLTLSDMARLKTDTISPYGRHVEQVTFGMHSGRVTISAKTRVNWRSYTGPSESVGCLSYDSIEIRINLSPVIFIASELPPGSCAHKAVLEHEKKHARVDRWIANKYAQRIGQDVRAAVNEAGAMGPYPASRMKAVQAQMIDHVRSTVKSIELLMSEEQARLQQQVDSMGEYTRVSKIVHETCGVDSRILPGKTDRSRTR